MRKGYLSTLVGQVIRDLSGNIKKCSYCNRPLVRRISAGHPEKLANSRVRKYCDQECMGHGKNKRLRLEAAGLIPKTMPGARPKCIKCGKHPARKNSPRNGIFTWGLHCALCHNPNSLKSLQASASWKWHRRGVIGFTDSMMPAEIAKQENKCAICEAEFVKEKKEPQVDHCHKTGAYRELLCRRCNTILGNCNDRPLILENCISYLLRHSWKPDEVAA